MIDVSRPNFSLSSPRIVYDSQTTTAEGCLYSLDWTTGLTFELTFERFSFQLL